MVANIEEPEDGNFVPIDRFREEIDAKEDALKQLTEREVENSELHDTVDRLDKVIQEEKDARDGLQQMLREQEIATQNALARFVFHRYVGRHQRVVRK